MRRHVISVLLENESGALSRVSGLFSARGYNIESLTVAATDREIMLLKVRAVDSAREELKRMADIFHGRILDVTESSYVIELTGNDHKVNAFLDAIGRDNVIEVVRSGTTGIARGDKSLKA